MQITVTEKEAAIKIKKKAIFSFYCQKLLSIFIRRSNRYSKSDDYEHFLDFLDLEVVFDFVDDFWTS